MDNFKKHLQQHLHNLDVDTPRDKVWLNIHKQLNPTKPLAALVYIKWAVAACAIALAGFGGYMMLYKPVTSYQLPVASNNNKTTNSKQKLPQQATGLQPAITQQLVANNRSVKPTDSQKQKINKPASSNQQSVTNITVLVQVENAFTQIINLQKAKVNTTPVIAENPSYFNDFAIEMKRIERDEQSIKKDIKKNGLTDELLDQLINVYQQKLNVLKQLQNEIHKTNNRFKQNRGPVDLTKPYFLNI
ncbi:MAG: hypothetical protein QM541_07520 [Flavobacterium sp.]|nr:hypothetical protein [Flavobacterium sp.]